METGAVFRHQLDEALIYVKKMAEHRRVIKVENDFGLQAVFFFSVCEDPKEFHEKGEWEYKDHYPEGHVLYIEKAICAGWNRDLRNRLKQIFLQKYPQLHTVTWHRIARWGDRQVRRHS